MDKPPREAQKQVDREQVRMLVASVGYQETEAKTGIAANTLYQWARRYGWKTPIPHKQKQVVRTVRSPAVALESILADDSKQTKIGFSRAARKVAAHLQESPVEELVKPQKAIAAKSWHGIAESVHGWREADPGSSPLNLQVLSNQTVISIGSDRTSAD